MRSSMVTLPSPCVTMRLGAGSALGIGSLDGAFCCCACPASTKRAAATQRMTAPQRASGDIRIVRSILSSHIYDEALVDRAFSVRAYIIPKKSGSTRSVCVAAHKLAHHVPVLSLI